MEEFPVKPARLHSAIHGILLVLLTLLSFVALAYTGYRLMLAQHLAIQWQVLPPPPASIAELLPTWAGVRILGTDDTTYVKRVYPSPSAHPWQMAEAISDPFDTDQFSPRCNREELPFSFSLRWPRSFEDCRRFRAHIEAPDSYVVLDGDGQLWVWFNSASWSGGLVLLGCVLALAFVLSPSVAILLRRALYRRVYGSQA